MKVVVTGGAGFIGSHLVDRLLEQNHQIMIIDNFSTGTANNVSIDHSERLNILALNMHSQRAFDAIITFEPAIIFHLAAQTNVRISVADPVLDAQANILGTLNILGAARAAHCKKVVFASSGGAIYGQVPELYLPIKESQSQRPISPYGVTKKTTADYLFAYHHMYKLNYVVLALGNVYGPRQNPGTETGVISIWAEQLAAQRPCVIFGDGKATRDYVHVDDVVEAFITTTQTTAADTRTLNIGTRQSTSTRDLYDLMTDIVPGICKPGYSPARTGELEHCCLDYALANKLLGWKPTIRLADGLKTVLKPVVP